MPRDRYAVLRCPSPLDICASARARSPGLRGFPSASEPARGSPLVIRPSRGYRCHDHRPRTTATAQRRAGTYAEVLDRVLQTARSDCYEGYSKHDGLNSPCWRAWPAGRGCAGSAAIQVVTRSPVDIRPLAGVRKARNAEGPLAVRPGAPGPAPDDRLGRRRRRGARAARLADRPPVARVRRPVLGLSLSRGRTSASSPPGTSRTGWSPRSSARPCSTGTRRCRTSRYLDAARQAVQVPARGPEDAVRGRRPPLRELRARPSHRLDRHGRLGPGRGPGRPAGRARRRRRAHPRGRPAGPLRGVEADRLRRLVLRRPAVGQPHHPRQLPHRLHPRRDPAVRAGRRQRRVRVRLPPGHRVLRAAAVRAGRRGPVHERPAVPDRHPRVRPGDHHVLAPAAAPRHRGRDARPGCCSWTLGQHVGPGQRVVLLPAAPGDTGRRIRELRWCQGWMSWALASYLENCGEHDR